MNTPPTLSLSLTDHPKPARFNALKKPEQRVVPVVHGLACTTSPRVRLTPVYHRHLPRCHHASARWGGPVMAARGPPMENRDKPLTNLTPDELEALRKTLAKIRDDRRAKRKPQYRSSKLDPYRHQLLALRNDGASLAEMKEYLATEGVTVGRTTIFVAFKRWSSSSLNKHPLSPASDRDKSLSFS